MRQRGRHLRGSCLRGNGAAGSQQVLGDRKLAAVRVHVRQAHAVAHQLQPREACRSTLVKP